MPPQGSGSRKGFLLGSEESRRRRGGAEQRVGPKRGVEKEKEEAQQGRATSSIIRRPAVAQEPSPAKSARNSAERGDSPGDSQAASAASAGSTGAFSTPGHASEGGEEAVHLLATNCTAKPGRVLVQVLDEEDGEGDERDRSRDPQTPLMHEPLAHVGRSKSSSGGGVRVERSADHASTDASTQRQQQQQQQQQQPAAAGGASEFVRFQSLWTRAHQTAVQSMPGGRPPHRNSCHRRDMDDGRQGQQPATARRVLVDFLGQHVGTDERWRWCWQLCCGDSPPTGQRRPSRKRLVTHVLLSEMLRTPPGIRSLRDCLARRDADSRAWTLGCLAWFDDVLLYQQEECDPLQSGPEQESTAKVLVANVLPFLVEIVEAEATHTVLAQCSLDTANEMVASLCDQLMPIRDGVGGGPHHDGAKSSLDSYVEERSIVQDLLFDVGPLMNRLWVVQRSWLESSKPKDQVGKVQNRCRRSVLSAWQASHSSAAKDSWCRDLCGCFASGSRLPSTLPEECLGFGGLAQTLGSRDQSLSEPAVVAILTAVDHDGDHENKGIALRGLLAWLGQRRKNLERLSRTAISRLLSLVHAWSSNLDAPSDTSVSATVIETLWVCALGLARSGASTDSPDISDTLSESFHSSVAWLLRSNTPVVQRLVALVGNLLIVQNDAALLRSLMTHPENAVVEVLLYTVRANMLSDLGVANVLRDDATKLLLSRLGDWPSVYRAMKHDATLFNASNPTEVTCLLTNVALEQRVDDSLLQVLVDSLVCVLGEQSRTPEGCGACVSTLAECLVRCEDEQSIESTFGPFCEKLGPRWRRSILSTNALRLVLVNLAEMILRHPSKLAPLSLLGAVVGNSSDYVDVDFNQDSLSSATESMVKLALKVLARRFAPCANCKSPADQSIQRLSPLLLLRRIPRCYYASLASAQDVSRTESRKDVRSLYEEVAREVAVRIEDDEGMESYTVDERRLAAEVGALLLPVQDLYRWVLFPSYESLTGSLESPEACEDRLVHKIRAFRAALYSGCHVVPFADDASGGHVLLKIASCSLSILRRESPATDRGECQEELYRLEAGCIDFLALCIQRLFEDDSYDSTTTTPASRSQSGSKCTALDSLLLLHESLTAIALTGTDDVVSNLLNAQEGERATVEFSVLARTCVWNSLLLVAKRSRVEHGHLKRFGAAFAPMTIEWGVSGPMDESARHPLCVAAAFQILLTLCVRSAFSDSNVVASMDGSRLDQLISWSLSVASSRLDSSVVHEARMSAVKLLLSLLASGAAADGRTARLVPAQRLLEILSLVGSIAERDPDTELQKFAMASVRVLRGDGASADPAFLTGMPAP